MFPVFHGLTKLDQLLDEISHRLAAVGGIRHETYRMPIAAVRSLYTIDNWNNSWEPYRNVVEQAILGMQFVAALENLRDAGSAASSSDVNATRAKIDELSRFLEEEPGIPRELKVTLLSLAEIMRRAVADYTIFGVQQLRDTLGIVLIRYHSETSVQVAPTNENSEEAVQKFNDALNAVQQMVTAGLGYTKQLDGREIVAQLTGAR